MYGDFLFRNLISEEETDGLNFAGIDIDPTFPQKPSKFQYITRCFLPANEDEIQKWVVKPLEPYINDRYVSVGVDDMNSPSKWIMLNGNVIQSGEKDTRFDLYLRSFLVPVSSTDSLIEQIEEEKINKYDLFHVYLEHYYIFAGLIPWSTRLPDSIIPFSTFDGEIDIIPTTSNYTLEMYHSAMNQTGHFPFLSKSISNDLSLNFSPKNIFSFSADGTPVTKYVHDDYSNFLFIKQEVVDKYLSDNKLCLLWVEAGSRYPSFKDHSKKYDPPMKDFIYVSKY